MTSDKNSPLSSALKALEKSRTDKPETDHHPSAPANQAAKSEQQDTPKQQTSSILEGKQKPFHLFSKILATGNTLWNGWLSPLTRWLAPITKRIWNFYRWCYTKFAHTGPKDNREFSRKRAGFVTIVLAAITLFTPIFLVKQAIPFTSRTLYDALMLASMREDSLYLSKPDIINAQKEIYQVTGCRNINGCDGGENTIYYRLRPNIIMSIQYWTTRFEPYDPAEISSAMVSELNECKIRYYGRRMKALGWYPYIVSASCKPVLSR